MDLYSSEMGLINFFLGVVIFSWDSNISKSLSPGNPLKKYSSAENLTMR